ncbi:hypothetical protein COU60_02795 [Candidatus Pacearchaeota archaeon CG10_big_fil_rev_8_21_14_0_10_34_76]|nr:MAG: hypothetical protein COU60_02795 [Candidatus Pacearchaeota archaeon CG10_big_fil_rev_8_21_14_0_10_34_76]
MEMRKNTKRKRILLVSILLLLIFLTGLLSAQTPTELDIPSTPPYLLENIPNQTWAKNTDNLNAFDLDNYFYSDLEISYTHSSPGNIDVLINSSTNAVSFYPDTNFEGSRIINFTATDGTYNVTSNLVNLTLVSDTTSPVWSSPSKNLVTIFQNSFVNFSTTWVDEIGLAGFTFSIDQGSGWEDYTGTFSGTQNTSIKRVQISSPGDTTIRWKFSASDTSGNSNVTDIQNFTVSESNSSSSSTESTTIASSSETSLNNFTIEPDYITVVIKQGQSTIRPIKITNIGENTLNFTAEIVDVTEFAKISDTNFILGAESSKSIQVEVKTTERSSPDIYFGKILIKAGEEVKQVPLVIEILPIEFDFEISVNVLNKNKEARQGESVQSEIQIKYLKDIIQKDFNLYLNILDLSGTTYDSSEENISMTALAINLNRELSIPENAKRGEYIFYARLEADNKSSSGSDIFEVGEKFNVAAFIKVNFIIILIVLSLFVSMGFVVSYHRNRKRVRLLNLYVAADELRKMIKAGKLDEAIGVYLRLKRMYGEPVPSGEIQDKEKLKEEMKQLIVEIDNYDIKKIPPAENPPQNKEENKDEKELTDEQVSENESQEPENKIKGGEDKKEEENKEEIESPVASKAKPNKPKEIQKSPMNKKSKPIKKPEKEKNKIALSKSPKTKSKNKNPDKK